VSGFAPLTETHRPITLVSKALVEDMEEGGGLMKVGAVLLEEVSRPAGLILFLAGLLALGYLGYETLRMDRIPRQRMYVVLILTFFSLVFWAFFEQGSTSLNNFTDRNVDRVIPDREITPADVGKTIKFRVDPETDSPELKKLPLLSQQQLGWHFDGGTIQQEVERAIRSQEKKKSKLKDKEIDDQVKAVLKGNVFTLTALDNLRAAAKDENDKDAAKTVEWLVGADNVGMGVGGSEVPAPVFQAVNPIYILIFGVILSVLWTFLGARGLEPNTPIKFAFGLIQLGLGFVALWYGAQTADGRGMVGVIWLLLGYLLFTTGELFLSPVGLSMVTKLSPKYLVSTVMGMWFLATAFAEFLAAILAQFTNVSGGEGGETAVPAPLHTVHVYGDVFGKIAVAALISGGICLVLAPILRRWMHEGVKVAEDEPAPRAAH
jgi:dipeptide/tripeptide permease